LFAAHKVIDTSQIVDLQDQRNPHPPLRWAAFLNGLCPTLTCIVRNVQSTEKHNAVAFSEVGVNKFTCVIGNREVVAKTEISVKGDRCSDILY
jgi:hypothetical protein